MQAVYEVEPTVNKDITDLLHLWKKKMAGNREQTMTHLNGAKDTVIPKQILKYYRFCVSTLDLAISLAVRCIYLYVFVQKSWNSNLYFPKTKKSLF